jgi:hypothetical protein
VAIAHGRAACEGSVAAGQTRRLTCRSTGAPTAGHLAREALTVYPAPRGQGVHPSSPGYLYVRLHVGTAAAMPLASSASLRSMSGASAARQQHSSSASSHASVLPPQSPCLPLSALPLRSAFASFSASLRRAAGPLARFARTPSLPSRAPCPAHQEAGLVGRESIAYCTLLQASSRAWAWPLEHTPRVQPNMSLNRTRYGMAAWPCSRLGSSSAARPGCHAFAGRLALR